MSADFVGTAEVQLRVDVSTLDDEIRTKLLATLKRIDQIADRAFSKIEQGADSSTRSVRRLASTLDRAADQLRGIDSIRLEVTGLEFLERQLDEITSDLKELRATGTASLSALERGFRSLDGSIELTDLSLQQLIARTQRVSRESTRALARGVTEASISGRTAESSFRSLNRAGNTLRFTLFNLRTVAVATGAALATRLAAGALDAVADFQQVRVSLRAFVEDLEGLDGAADTTNRLVDQLQEVAKSTPFNFVDLAESTRRLAAFSDTIGLTGATFEETFGNAQDAILDVSGLLAVLGQDSATLQRVVKAIGDIGARDRLTGEEVRQLANALPGFDVIGEIADELREMGFELDATGLSAASFTQAGAGASDIVQALLSAMREFPGAGRALRAQAESVRGVIERLGETTLFAAERGFRPLVEAFNTGFAAQFEAAIGPGVERLTGAISRAAIASAPALLGLGESLLDVFAIIVEEGDAAFTALVEFSATVADAFGVAVDAAGPLLDILATVLRSLADLPPEVIALTAAFAGLGKVLRAIFVRQDGVAAITSVQALRSGLRLLRLMIVEVATVVGSSLAPALVTMRAALTAAVAGTTSLRTAMLGFGIIAATLQANLTGVAVAASLRLAPALAALTASFSGVAIAAGTASTALGAALSALVAAAGPVGLVVLAAGAAAAIGGALDDIAGDTEKAVRDITKELGKIDSEGFEPIVDAIRKRRGQIADEIDDLLFVLNRSFANGGIGNQLSAGFGRIPGITTGLERDLERFDELTAQLLEVDRIVASMEASFAELGQTISMEVGFELSTEQVEALADSLDIDIRDGADRAARAVARAAAETGSYAQLLDSLNISAPFTGTVNSIEGIQNAWIGARDALTSYVDEQAGRQDPLLGLLQSVQQIPEINQRAVDLLNDGIPELDQRNDVLSLAADGLALQRKIAADAAALLESGGSVQDLLVGIRQLVDVGILPEDFATKLVDQNATAQEIVNSLLPAVNNAVRTVAEQAGTEVPFLEELLSGGVSAVEDKSAELQRIIEHNLGGLENDVASPVEGIAARLADIGSTMLDFARTQLGPTFDAFFRLGQTVVEGFEAGLARRNRAIEAASRRLAAQAEFWMRRQLRSSSPSKVAIDIGRSVPRGFAIGLSTELDRVARAAQALADAGLDPLSDDTTLTGFRDFRRALEFAPGSPVSNTSSVSTDNRRSTTNLGGVNILIDADDQSPDAIAQAVQERLVTAALVF